MKSQALNRSLGRNLAVAAIAFMISSAASAQIPQSQWGTDGCFYAAVGSGSPGGAQQSYVQMVRQGCAVQSTDGQARYYDLRTGQLYVMENNPSQPGSKVGKFFKALITNHKQVLQVLQTRRAELDSMNPQAMPQEANPATMALQATQQGAYPAPMFPQPMQPGANSAPMVSQAMQPSTRSVPMIPQAMPQGTSSYFGVSSAVGEGTLVTSGQNGACDLNQPNCLQTGGPRAPAGNVGVPLNAPAQAIQLRGKQSRTKTLKAWTAPGCAASYAGCQ